MPYFNFYFTGVKDEKPFLTNIYQHAKHLQNSFEVKYGGRDGTELNFGPIAIFIPIRKQNPAMGLEMRS